MKILFANSRHFYGGGDSTYTFSLAGLLKQHGHDVSFFAMEDDRNLDDPNKDLFVPFIDFRKLNQKKSLSTGFRVLGRAIYSHEARQKFSILLDRVRPDIVHLQNIHAHITPSVIFEAKQRGLPVVWTLHDYKLICPNSHLMVDVTGELCEACVGGSFLRAALNRCKKGSLLASGMAAAEALAHRFMGVKKNVDAFFAPSRFLVRKLRQGGFTNGVHHVPLFIDYKSFQLADKDDGYILFFGRLDPIKGIYTLLEAAKKIPNVRIVCAGRIHEAEETRIKTQLGNGVEYVGFKTGEELRKLIRRCRGVAVPSLWYENQPFSILEAFATGKPVIASDLGGMSELVAHMERGLLVKPKDPEHLAKAMTWLAEHAAEAQKMGLAARTYVERAHSPDSHYEKVTGIYSRLLRQVKSRV
jgi:glycosyltransferase involved in cell wall biosynthesis